MKMKNYSKIAYHDFWDFRKNQYYFYDYSGQKYYFKNNQWYWNNKKRNWYKFTDNGLKIETKDDMSFKASHRFTTWI